MDADEYLASRLEAEIKWYDKKSRKDKAWNTFCKTAEIGLRCGHPIPGGVHQRRPRHQ